MQTIQQVSWNTYAQKYDMLLSYNPFYQQLHEQVLAEVKKWAIETGDRIADIGAGTGNYSVAIAKHFPQATVLHLDKDEGMNAVAAAKKERTGLTNLLIHGEGIEEAKLPEGSLRGLVCIHALYTFPDPGAALEKMYRALQPGGYALLVDAGRIVDVLSWKLAIGWHLFKNYGVKKMLDIMQEGKEVSQQNAYIRQMQREGTFWTHSHEEFCAKVALAGFEIVSSHVTFRGVSDFVVAVRGERLGRG